MRKIGLIGIIMSSLLLSLEIYMLKIIQSLEMAKGSWRTSAWGYLSEPTCAVGFGITICILVGSIILFCRKGND